MVRPAWAHTCGCKSRCELVTVSKAKRSCIRVASMTMMATCYNLKRLAKFLNDGVDAFYKACLSKSEVRPQGANA